MCLRVEAERGDTNTHRTALIVNQAKTHFVNIKEGISLPLSQSWNHERLSVHLEKGK